MKERIMADLLIGNARFDKNRKPTNIEVSVLAALSSGKRTGVTFDLLKSSAEEAAHEEKPSEAVSVIASIVAATALYFPDEFFLVEKGKKLPLFLDLLEITFVDLHRPLLTVGVNRVAVLAKEGVVFEKWCWGVSIGILQTLRWISPSAAPIVIEAYWQALSGVVAPFFTKYIDCLDVKPMPNPLDAYQAAVIIDLAKERSDQFELLVRQMAKQHRGPDFYGYSKQVSTELRNRYWYTRSEKQQEEMITK